MDLNLLFSTFHQRNNLINFYLNHMTALQPKITDVRVMEGEDLILTCNNSNNLPSVSQSWLNAEGNVVSNKSVYLVENVNRSFTGVYTCVLSGVNNYTKEFNTTVAVLCEY